MLKREKSQTKKCVNFVTERKRRKINKMKNPAKKEKQKDVTNKSNSFIRFCQSPNPHYILNLGEVKVQDKNYREK
jgi:hypothetical protein